MCSICNKTICCCPRKTTVKYGTPNARVVKGAKGETGATGATGPSNLTIQNTIFVSKNGNDSTGLVERLDKPFLTITAAINAANTAYPSRGESIRPLIVVYPGKYVENVILKKFIDFDLQNIILDGCITDNQVDFGSTDDDVFTNIIYGQSSIINTGTGSIPTCVLLWKPNTKLLMHCDTLRSTTDDTTAFINTKKTRIYANRIVTESTAENYMCAVEMSQGYTSSDYTASLVEIIGADIYNTADSKAAPISFSSGGETKNQTLTLINCRVKNFNDAASDAHSSAITCGTLIASNGKLNLYNTTIVSTGGNSIYVQSTNILTVKYFHSNMANVATGGAGTLTASLGALTVDAAVTAEI